MPEGAPLGTPVGMPVGAPVGAPDAAAIEGIPEGAPEGAPLGIPDGAWHACLPEVPLFVDDESPEPQATRRIAVVGESGDGLHIPLFTDDVDNDAWADAYREVRERVLRAWESDERLASRVRVPWGEIPGRDALSAYVMEIVVHTWDLSEGLGRPLPLDAELAEFSLAAARGAVPDGPREDRPFAPAVPAPEGADVHTRLAAWLGRRPLSPA